MISTRVAVTALAAVVLIALVVLFGPWPSGVTTCHLYTTCSHFPGLPDAGSYQPGDPGGRIGVPR